MNYIILRLLHLLFGFVICNLSNFKLNIQPTPQFQGFFVRRLTPDHLYFGNIYNDYVYSISSNKFSTQTTRSICADGTACPAVISRSDGFNLIKISNSEGYIEISNDDDILNSLSGNSVMTGVFYLEGVNLFAVGIPNERYSFYKSDGTNVNSIQISTNNIGIIATSNTKMLIFIYQTSSSLGCTFCYQYYDVTSNTLSGITGWKSLDNNGEVDISNYYQLVKVDNNSIIGCALTTNKQNIICFSGVYNNNDNTFSIIKGFTTIIESCQVSNKFSFALLNSNQAIVSCGINQLKLAIIDTSFTQPIKTTIKNQSQNSYLDFMVYSDNLLYIIMAQPNVDTEAYEYYADYLLPNFSGTTSITKLTPSSMESIFSMPTTFKIKITGGTSISDIYSGNTAISLNTEYSISELWYKPQTPGTFTMSYQLIQNSLFNNHCEIEHESGTTQETLEYTFRVCSLSCGSCSSHPNESSNKDNCDSCDHSSGYYESEDSYTDDKGNILYNCYRGSVNGYYLDKTTQPYMYKKCYSSCETCSVKGDDTYHKCLTCKSGYHFIEDRTGNCENDSTILTNDYTYSYVLSDSLYKKCAYPCKTCTALPSNGNEYCSSCRDGFVTDPLNNLNCIIDCPFSKFYIQNGNYICTTDDNCPPSFPLLVTDSNQCVSSCLDISTCKYCKDNLPLYEYDNTCIKACPSGFNVNNYKCEETQNDNDNNNEDDNNNDNENNEDNNNNNNNNIFSEIINNGDMATMTLPRSFSSNDFKEQKDTAIEHCLTNSDKPITSMEGPDYEFNFYSSNINKETVLENGLPYVNLQTCEEILRKTYNIPENEQLFIGQMVYDSTTLSSSASNKLQYEIYRESSQTKLDITPCNDIPISITKPLTNVEGIDFDLAEDLKDQGIDIFNKDDPIFNDRCTTLSLNGKDVSMSTRHDEIYAGVELCEEGCNVKEMNYSSQIVECECKPQTEGFDALLEDNEILGMFNNFLSSTNFDLFMCYRNIEHAFMKQQVFENIGSVIYVAVCVIIMVLVIVFWKCQIKTIYGKLNTKIPFVPPLYKKDINIYRQDNIPISKHKIYEKQKSKQNQNKKCVQRHEENTMNVISSTSSRDKEISTKRMIHSNSNKNRITNSNQPFNKERNFLCLQINSCSNNSNNNNNYTKNDILHVKPHHTLNKKHSISNNKLNKKNFSQLSFSSSSLNNDNNNKQNELEQQTTFELNNCRYKEALRKDKRSFCKYYFNILIEKQIILSTFLNNSIFYPFSLRIVLLLFTLSSFFFINALLFTEDYITNRYNTKESLGFVYMLKNELSRTMYSSIIGMFIGKFLNMLTSSEIEFVKLTRSNKNKSTYLQSFRDLVNDMRKKFIIIIIIVIILMMIYWYFITVFCFIYQNNQISWIESSLFSIGLNIIIPIILCFLIAVLRKIGLKGECGLLYSISVCLYTII